MLKSKKMVKHSLSSDAIVIALITLACNSIGAVSGIRVFMRSVSLTTETGLDVLNHHGRDLGANNKLSLDLALHNDSFGSVSTINCPDLEPIEDMLCPFDKNVTFSVYTSSGVEKSQGYLCHTYANKDSTCMVTLNKHGSVHGLWFGQRNVVDFAIEKNCRTNNCARINLNPTIEGCGADKLKNREQERRLGTKNKKITERSLSWEENNWLEKWDNCYPGDDSMTNLYMGLAIGSTLTSTLGSVSNVQSWLESVVSEANVIFRTQLNVKLHITEVVILTSAGSASFDNPGCAKTINEAFDSFTNWEKPVGTNVALWHYFDDCHKNQAPAIGLGYIGALCNSRTNTGISHYGDGGTRTWLTFTHEVGHNLGARHTFQEGEGTTGGIMDYGDKLFNNEYQFNAKYSKSEICNHLSSRFSSSSCTGKFDLNPTGACGNGILESNEECECPSGTNCACCKNCQLKTGAQCSPYFESECCTSSCQYADTWTECHHSDGGVNGLGYCRNGVCASPDCGFYGLGSFCGVHSDNPCKKKCMYAGSCQSMNGWTSNGEPINLIRDGALCTTPTVSFGECRTGTCIAVPNPYPNPAPISIIAPTNFPSPTPTSFPTPAPTNFPTPAPSNFPPNPAPSPTDNCLDVGARCFDNPEGCCDGLYCPMDEYYAEILPQRKVKCQIGGGITTSSPAPTTATTTIRNETAGSDADGNHGASNRGNLLNEIFSNSIFLSLLSVGTILAALLFRSKWKSSRHRRNRNKGARGITLKTPTSRSQVETHASAISALPPTRVRVPTNMRSTPRNYDVKRNFTDYELM